MDTAQLIATGLNELQAKMYALLLEEGTLTPPRAAKALQINRTNAYKLLDKLVELGLAIKDETPKKVIYLPDNPLALTRLAAQQRDEATARENAVNRVLQDLLVRYYEHTEKPSVEVVTGREAVVGAYRQQIEQLQPIYFIRSRADIATMGFDTMKSIRTMSAPRLIKRYGITPDMATGQPNVDTGLLTRTWVRNEDYSAPVEWSVSGSMLLIVLFGSEPHAVIVTNPIVADAFRQIHVLLSSSIQAMKYYKDLPRKIPKSK